MELCFLMRPVIFYGTTYYGGTNGLGAVYKLSPTLSGEWDERVIYSFHAGNDGNSSISNLVSDATGNLYATTSEGGLGSGTIFKLSLGSNETWTESIPHSFQGSLDGAFPYAGMVGDGSGRFFGATVHGGDDGDGTIYKFTPELIRNWRFFGREFAVAMEPARQRNVGRRMGDDRAGDDERDELKKAVGVWDVALKKEKTVNHGGKTFRAEPAGR